MSESTTSPNYIELSADIVSAYVSNNSVPARSELARNMGLGQQRRKGAALVKTAANDAAPAKPKRGVAKVAATSDEVIAPAKRRRTKKAA